VAELKLQNLKDELINDPLARGYVGMTNEQAAASLVDVIDRDVVHSTLTAAQIYETIDRAEYLALVEPHKSEVNILLGLGGDISIVVGRKARGALVSAFLAGSFTRSALIAAASHKVSRAVELFGGSINHGFRTTVDAVAAARALP